MDFASQHAEKMAEVDALIAQINAALKSIAELLQRNAP